MFATIRIVLLNTSHPGNIGSAARAMKTMGLSRLYLVQPKSFPDDKATELAAGADDILENVVITDSINEAVKDCRLVIGASARERELTLPQLDPRQCAQQLTQEGDQGEVALVFGNERTGLTTEQLQSCQYHVVIPANPDYNSLNLAAAVQVLCYEIRMSQSCAQLIEKPHEDYATNEEVERFYQHLREVLLAIGFLNPKHPKRLMPRLKRLFNRVRLEQTEVNLLRGILSMMKKSISRI